MLQAQVIWTPDPHVEPASQLALTVSTSSFLILFFLPPLLNFLTHITQVMAEGEISILQRMLLLLLISTREHFLYRATKIDVYQFNLRIPSCGQKNRPVKKPQWCQTEELEYWQGA